MSKRVDTLLEAMAILTMSDVVSIITIEEGLGQPDYSFSKEDKEALKANHMAIFFAQTGRSGDKGVWHVLRA